MTLNTIARIRDLISKFYYAYDVNLDYVPLIRWLDHSEKVCVQYEKCRRMKRKRQLTAEDAAVCNFCADLLGIKPRFRHNKK